MEAFRPPSICAHASHSALATAGGTKSEVSLRVHFTRFVKIVSPAPAIVEPSSRMRDTEMNSLATRSAVVECRARASPLRCRIRDLLEPKSTVKRLSRQRHNEGGRRLQGQ